MSVDRTSNERFKAIPVKLLYCGIYAEFVAIEQYQALKADHDRLRSGLHEILGMKYMGPAQGVAARTLGIELPTATRLILEQAIAERDALIKQLQDETSARRWYCTVCNLDSKECGCGSNSNWVPSSETGADT